MRARILIVDDEQSMREFLEIFFRRQDYDVATAASVDEALAEIESKDFDLVISDIQMPGRTGIELLKILRKDFPDILVIMITAFGTTETAIEAMKDGAYDYITKPFKVDEIRLVVEKALEKKTLYSENRRLRKELQTQKRERALIGNSPKMLRTLDLIQQVASTKTNVLITGASGTGKELVARAVHDQSDRRDGPFVAINCAAIPENLLESELFGHVKGAFTNAVSHREGRFAAADGGTIFLDEIGDMSPSLQVKLLRVLQERTFEPVGSSRSQTVDVRVIAATNQNLEEAIRKGRFREDLFYRLNVIPIEIPPLRERKEDIPLLIHHFLDKMNTEKGRSISGITPQAMALLTDYDWPGNVRELENLIERLCVLRDHGAIDVADLPKPFHRQAPTAEVLAPKLPLAGLDFREVVNRFESDLIQQALKRTKGNKNQAAQLLGLNRTTLLEKMKKKGLDAESDAADAETDTRSEAAPE